MSLTRNSPHRLELLMYWNAEPKSFSAKPDLHISLKISWARVPSGVADSVLDAASWDNPRSFNIRAEPNPPCKSFPSYLGQCFVSKLYTHLVVIGGGHVFHDTRHRVVGVDWPASACCRTENLSQKLLVQTETGGKFKLNTLVLIKEMNVSYLMPRFMVSETPIMETARSMLLHILTACPVPTAPQCVMFLPIMSRTARARSKSDSPAAPTLSTNKV